MLNLIIDDHLCIQCGQCAADCPVLILDMSQGIPFIPEHRASHCLGCQHCLAICPTGALSILGADPKQSMALSFPRPEQMESLIKGRRSVRRYRAQRVAQETIDQLLEIMAYVPTGQNKEQIRWTLIDDPQVMEQIRVKTYAGIGRAVEQNTLPPRLKAFAKFKIAYEQGRDIIYRFAPHMVLASAPQDSPSPEADPFIALTYFELMAHTLGLGTLWCGYARWAIKEIVPELAHDLALPADHHSLYALMFGYPEIEYARSVQRVQKGVHRVSLHDIQPLL